MAQIKYNKTCEICGTPFETTVRNARRCKACQALMKEERLLNFHPTAFANYPKEVTCKLCEDCGKVITYVGRDRKYCEDCRRLRRNAYQQKYRRNHKEKKLERARCQGDNTPSDSKEVIDMCLHCTVPAEKCNGNCSLVHDAQRNTIHANRLRSEFLSKNMFERWKNGESFTNLAKELGCSERSVRRYVKCFMEVSGK